LGKSPIISVLLCLSVIGVARLRAVGFTCAPVQPGIALSAAREVVRSSSNRVELEQAASALAGSSDPRDLTLLGQLLRDRGFLGRLDDSEKLQTLHLGKVMETLASHPSPQTAALCLTLANDPVFLAEDDRKSLLLVALAAVKPMSVRAVAVFQQTNEEGYFSSNAVLLAGNGSPRALTVFESMMLDHEVPIARRIDLLHASIVPRRTELPILGEADRMVSRTSEPALAAGVIESVFDFQPSWFGRTSNIRMPPPWTSASPDSLRAALQLAEKAEARPRLSPSLRKKVAQEREMIARALGQH
jgi:hypothetical protein